ncbi:MAG: FmdB family zinc ribbon protein [Planctomycetota bacterium]
MPTYEYKCEDCSHVFEAFHGMTDDPLEECPKCGEKALRRLIGGGAGIIFKGSGFWETDYNRSGSSQDQETTSGDSSSGSDSSGDSDSSDDSSGDED